MKKGIFLVFLTYFPISIGYNEEEEQDVYPRVTFHESTVVIDFSIKSDNYRYRLIQNPHLISEWNCYYVSVEPNSSAALDLCTPDEIRGFITDNTGYRYIIEPNFNKSHRLKRIKRESHSDLNGYYVDTFWTSSDRVRSPILNDKTPQWLETVVAVDYSVIDFHGKETVRRYVMTLLNIVSAIYGDPTLSANLKFVITKLIFFDDPKDCLISVGKSEESLENVNKWNQELWHNSTHKHDIAIWLTRLEIGGPSGYAPVAGVCDPTRSCTLNRDEGLSSAFIIAHEIGHIFGLSHDGIGNSCYDEVDQGSMMAPMVGATFSYFHWSPCSAEEFHYKSSSWDCLFNNPEDQKNVTFIGDVIEFTYSLDDQCRMEFGEGFQFCTSFELTDPCTHLWCSHESSPDVCKTKQGPPMDGTECGESKWCVNGYCESMTKRRTNKDGLRHNTLDGSWSDWSPWRECSRSCNTGVQFRTRNCDNPRPSYGGAPCPGENNEFRLCNLEPCYDVISDFRAQQCYDKFQTVEVHPFEHEDDYYKCKLTCFNRRSNEFFISDENVIDGTLCSYDDPANICVQGRCLALGCDKIIGSPVEEDDCGVCGGDGSKCVKAVEHIVKEVEDRNAMKIFTIPKGARNINITATIKSQDFLGIVTLRSAKYGYIFSKHYDHSMDTKNGSNITSSVVVDGTKFSYFRDRENITMFSKGRGILNPVSIYFMNGLGILKVTLTYFLSKSNQSDVPRFKWVLKKWSKCSVKCGGGIQYLISKCVDKKSGMKVRRSRCGPERFDTRSRPCNTFSCDFEWITTRWEECTQSCGKNGVQIRRTFCVPINGTRNEMSHPKFCRGTIQPERKRQCNRFPCIVPWRETDHWSECSANECGKPGIKLLIFECPRLRSCGVKPFIAERCVGKCGEDDYECLRDESVVCADEVMMKYCSIPSYRKRCCKSCALPNGTINAF